MDTKNRFLLVVRRGPQRGHSFQLDGALASIGRYAGNTIVIPDETVSRHHARFRRTNQGYVVEDLSSANGLFVNGKRVTDPRPLTHGDVIRLGDLIELAYEVMSESEAVAQEASLIPAFDDLPTSKEVSDTGGTVWMKAVPVTGRDEPKPVAGRSRAGLWVAVAAGLIILAVAGYFLFIAGH
jgi:FHA domain